MLPLSLTRERRYSIQIDIFSRSSSRLFNTPPHFLLNVTWSFFWLLLDVWKGIKSSGCMCMGIIKTFCMDHIPLSSSRCSLSLPLKEKSWLIKILFHSVYRKWQKFWARPVLSRLFGCCSWQKNQSINRFVVSLARCAAPWWSSYIQKSNYRSYSFKYFGLIIYMANNIYGLIIPIYVGGKPTS